LTRANTGFTVVLLTGLLIGAAPAGAVERCKVQVGPQTGLLEVSAKNVAGVLTWSDTPTGAPHLFFDPSCVADGKAKGCLLDDPVTLAARTPPSGCTIVVTDATSTCTAHVPGCTPGVRPLDLPRAIVGTWTLHGGETIAFNVDGTFANSEGTTGTYRIVGNSILLDIDNLEGEFNGVLTYLGTLPNGQLIFAQENVLGLTRVP